MKIQAACAANLKMTARTLALVAVTVGCAALTACNSSRVGSIETGAGVGSGASAPPSNIARFDEKQDPRAYCPRAVMRAGTQTLDVYPDNVRADDPERSAKLIYRGTITDLVRECNYGGPKLYIKVGIAGRILTGPAGQTGDYSMPIRVVVTAGDQVLYSQLHEVSAQIPPGRSNNAFSFIDDQIVLDIPEKENIIIYAGYDEQRVDLPGSIPVDEGLQPIN